jgi:hypothetical protein
MEYSLENGMEVCIQCSNCQLFNIFKIILVIIFVTHFDGCFLINADCLNYPIFGGGSGCKLKSVIYFQVTDSGDVTLAATL